MLPAMSVVSAMPIQGFESRLPRTGAAVCGIAVFVVAGLALSMEPAL